MSSMGFLQRGRAMLGKARRILDSELARLDGPGYVLDELLERAGIYTTGPRVYRLRGGCKVFLRPGTTDGKVFDEVFIDCIYAAFAGLVSEGGKPSVLVDLGANIGLSALFLQRNVGFDRVIALEPDSENLRMLRRNLDENLRVPYDAIQAFAGAERGFAQVLDPGYGAWGLRMGEAADAGVPVLPMSAIVPEVAGGVFLKCDIEGAERLLFPQIASWDRWVSFIVLELHTEYFTLEQLQDALGASNFEWHVFGDVPRGAVLAVLGLERGAWKATLQSERDSRNHSRGAAAV